MKFLLKNALKTFNKIQNTEHLVGIKAPLQEFQPIVNEP